MRTWTWKSIRARNLSSEELARLNAELKAELLAIEANELRDRLEGPLELSQDPSARPLGGVRR